MGRPVPLPPTPERLLPDPGTDVPDDAHRHLGHRRPWRRNAMMSGAASIHGDMQRGGVGIDTRCRNWESEEMTLAERLDGDERGT